MADIKAWLSRAKHIDDEINTLLKEQERALTRALGTVNCNEGERVQTTPQNGSERRFIAYAEYSRIIDERIDELYTVKCEIFKAISRIDDGTLRTLLELRYLGLKTWEEIAVEMNYSYMHICRLHGKALNNLKDVIECYTDSLG